MSSSNKSSVCMCGKGQHGTSHKSRIKVMGAHERFYSNSNTRFRIKMGERLELGVVVGSWVGRLKTV